MCVWWYDPHKGILNLSAAQQNKGDLLLTLTSFSPENHEFQIVCNWISQRDGTH